MVQQAEHFVAVFIDTQKDEPSTCRFGENYGSYPVLRIQDHQARDLLPKLDSNITHGIVPVEKVLDHLKKGQEVFLSKSP